MFNTAAPCHGTAPTTAYDETDHAISAQDKQRALWTAALQAAQHRGEDECPICVSAIELQPTIHDSKSARQSDTKGGSQGLSRKLECDGARNHSKDKACVNRNSGSACGAERDQASSEAMLLSCSHVFHSKCLTAFEQFNIYEVKLCPVCRAAYQSMPLAEVTQRYQSM